MAVGGVLMLMVAKGHYSIDVVSFMSILIKLIVNRIAKIIAYFVTTRLWYILHSIINTRQLQTRTSANFLSRSAHCSCPPQGQFHHFCSYRLWWWRLIVWYEENVKAPVPYKFEIPNPSFSLTRVRDPSRDI